MHDPGASWQPSAPLANLRLRAQLLARVRAFFAAREVLEVETPCLARFGVSDPHITNPVAELSTREGRRLLYLQSSPEYAMKRLLAAGSGPIYQLSRCFRDAEDGALHNPEFTLLEWYRPGMDHLALMDEVADLLGEVLPGAGRARTVDYRQAFTHACGVDPFEADLAALRSRCAAAGAFGDAGADDAGWSRDACIDWLFSNPLQAALGAGIVHVSNFPVQQAALARLDPEGASACRFETFVNGIELANGYHELLDADELARRDSANGRASAEFRAGGMRPGSPVDSDTRLLDAMRAGLPDCAGVALGFDRLVMLAAGAQRISDVIAFDVQRA